mmetsp:Transcript_2020/g.5849  ORF Transcript_2020/g.5849 Transcript_2020/m.5849 type:complete len:176 (-) Transcript_2020:232-759(-)
MRRAAALALCLAAALADVVAALRARAGVEACRRKYGRGIDCYVSPGGFEVLCGRTAATHEVVSLEIAMDNDDFVWLHAGGGIPGSHVLILADWGEVSRADIIFAAKLAAHFSQFAKVGGGKKKKAPVEYCRASQVQKKKGTPKGQVFLMGAVQSINVEPGLPIELDDDPPGLISE